MTIESMVSESSVTAADRPKGIAVSSLPVMSAADKATSSATASTVTVNEPVVSRVLSPSRVVTA